MKKVLFTICALCFTIGAFSQDAVSLISQAKTKEDSLRIGFWTPRNTQLGVNFNQASFSNWQGGGINNYAIGALFNNKAEYYKNKGVFSTDIQFQLGSLSNKGQRRVKSIDRLFMDAKYARKINAKWNWFVGVNFISQFAPGYAYERDGQPNEVRRTISNFLAPGYLSEGIGIEYKPTKHFVLQLGGATMRQTFVTNNTVFEDYTALNGKETAYGVEKGKKVLNEMGFQVVAAYDKDIAKNLNLKFRYQGFLAYAPKTRPIDHNLSLIATAKVNKFLNLNFTLLGIYDEDQISKFQISQGFGAGLLFKL